jgi:tRNA A-37 threonylcarbamoyl transferase component Bud32
MSVRWNDVRLYASGAHWRGKILAGVSGIPELCMSLDSSGVALCKDRPKIKAGCINGYFIKRYNLPGFITQLRRRFKTPRPLKVLAGAEQLGKLGIYTPEVIAALVENRKLLRREFLVTAELPETTVTLHQKFRAAREPREIWELLMLRFVPDLCRLHDSGWVHGDLNLRNITFDSASGKCGLIDLDGMEKFSAPLSIRKRSREIARLVSGYSFMTRDTAPRDELISCAIDTYRKSCGVELDRNVIKTVTEQMIVRGGKYR